MNIKNIATCLLTGLLLSGCASNNGTVYQYSPEANTSTITTKYSMIGLPILYQGFGTTIPITKKLSITAAHVAKLNWNHVIAYHPQTDIAIIEQDNSDVKTFPKLGVVYKDKPIYTYGSNWLGHVLTSQGYYRTDYKFVNVSYFKKHAASIMDATIQEGMSGGAVVNNKGELVGVISSMASSKNTRDIKGFKLPYERLSLFVAVYGVRGWINETVNNYYHSQQNILQWDTDGLPLIDNSY